MRLRAALVIIQAAGALDIEEIRAMPVQEVEAGLEEVRFVKSFGG